MSTTGPKIVAAVMALDTAPIVKRIKADIAEGAERATWSVGHLVTEAYAAGVQAGYRQAMTDAADAADGQMQRNAGGPDA
ncbi:unannotated protein [freshwater metagenome]|uniref:Unannotated protein n=1 Tax=freshwater metagenome TaxID=449393 RepID=A0A6J7GPT5_9ZZZZ|nr:hypothetical protein [Actinomycetota bacterium]